MKAFAFACLILGLLASAFMVFRSPQTEVYTETKHQMLAINFAIFRNAAHQFVHHNQNDALTMGTIPQASFVAWLPSGWQPMRDWKVRVESSVCYVYGATNSDEADAIRRLLYRGSYALGRKEQGQLVPDHDGAMPIPDWIPEGNLVSMTGVRP